MSKAITLAAALIGAGLGYDCCYTNRTDDTELEEDIRLYSEAAFYAPYAAAMVEAAFGVTFTYPETWQWEIYRYFGELIGDNTEFHCSGSKFKLPDHTEMLDLLENLVYDTFKEVAVETQYESLRETITRVRAELA